MEIDSGTKQAERISDQRSEHTSGDNPPAIEDMHVHIPTNDVLVG
jgi:hypothetical protein